MRVRDPLDVDLHDADLQDEIETLMRLIAAAITCEGSLDPALLDRLLGG